MFTKTCKICFKNLLITMTSWRNYDVIENAMLILCLYVCIVRRGFIVVL